MMRCVILYRTNDTNVEAVLTEEGEISEFADLDAAVVYARANRLFESGQAAYQIVELDEL